MKSDVENEFLSVEKGQEWNSFFNVSKLQFLGIFIEVTEKDYFQSPEVIRSYRYDSIVNRTWRNPV